MSDWFKDNLLGLLPPLSMDLKPTNGYGLHIVIISHVEVERSNGIAETAEPAS